MLQGQLFVATDFECCTLGTQKPQSRIRQIFAVSIGSKIVQTSLPCGFLTSAVKIYELESVSESELVSLTKPLVVQDTRKAVMS